MEAVDRAVVGAVRPVRVRAVMVPVVVVVLAVVTAVLVVATAVADGAMVLDVAAGAIARKAPSVRASASSPI
ncbi:hypothetical protein [Archangium lansingense]|uniref:Uncharacterized protein n=1 Tax=Archangium lansingense TaxID=2995310 RepID=A0ABT4AEA1_9BACT|nr:hypothetical protein [Archangium lansinium]MCY1079886.1 hypothetical protein [Archangium lansinium]